MGPGKLSEAMGNWADKFGEDGAVNIYKSLSNDFTDPSQYKRLLGEGKLDEFLGIAADGTPASTLVPGGGLFAHEAAGGHVIQKHVSKTDDQLVQRFSFPGQANIRGSGSFTDMRTAEKAVSDSLTIRSSEIQTWLRGADPRLSLANTQLSYTVGRVVPRGSTIAHDSSIVDLFLIRDPSIADTGYRIISGFPGL